MSEKLKSTAKDWSMFDAHVISPEEYDEIPELTDAFFEQADVHVNGKLIQRGRPKADTRKVLLSVRYSPEVVAYFRATGRGWQTRMDEALKEWLKEHAA